jgi:hypothetical protein
LRELQRELQENEAPSAEGLAMVDLYRADWHLLFDQDQALTAYQEAFTALSEAGIETDKLNGYFSRPQRLPLPAFYHSVDQALESAGSSAPRELTLSGVEPGSHLYFQEWFDSLPDVTYWVASPLLRQELTADYTDTLLRIRLNSLDKVSRWVKGTYQTRMGVVAEFEPLHDLDSQTMDLENWNQRMHQLHFRPRLEDGTARPFEGTLLYSAASENF